MAGYIFTGDAPNETPVWGVELDPATMKPLWREKPLIYGNPFDRGYERMGVDNSIFPNSQEAVEQQYQGFLKMQHMTEDMLPKEMIPLVKGMFTEKPFIEGPWMDKYNGKYYLQYACPRSRI